MLKEQVKSGESSPVGCIHFPSVMGSVLKLPEESCSVIKLMHCKKARLQAGIIGIERRS